MNKIKDFMWSSPVIRVTQVDKKHSEATKKDYAVVKGFVEPSKAPREKLHAVRQIKHVTFLCFKENLLDSIDADEIYSFEGKISFTWGSTYLNIEKVFDANGTRILKREKDEKQHEYAICKGRQCDECLESKNCPYFLF